jgi:hypothetical protein
MSNSSPLSKIHCELGITSKSVTPDEITQNLNITPTRQIIRGTIHTTKNKQYTFPRSRNIWAVASPSIISTETDIGHHILFFRDILSDKIDLLEYYKNHDDVEVVFTIHFETEFSSAGIGLSTEEMKFLTLISNRVSYFVFFEKQLDGLKD